MFQSIHERLEKLAPNSNSGQLIVNDLELDARVLEQVEQNPWLGIRAIDRNKPCTDLKNTIYLSTTCRVV